MSAIQEKIDNLKRQLEDISTKVNRSNHVKIIAASKTRSFQEIVDVYNAGINHIGENRIQEANKKFESFDSMPNITRRFIGHLQTNKVNKCLELFDTIDSVDSLKLAEKINNRSSFLNKKTSILLEINTSGDGGKKGFSPNLDDDFYSIFGLDNLKVDGLMTMGPLSQKENETRTAFALLRKIKTKINDQLPGEPIKELSMGMSGDFQIGIEEGSTMIRLGTAIFGKRNY